jgi:hypothetical protein
MPFLVSIICPFFLRGQMLRHSLAYSESESVSEQYQHTVYFIMHCHVISCWVWFHFCPGQSDSHWSSRNSFGSHVVTFISLYTNHERRQPKAQSQCITSTCEAARSPLKSILHRVDTVSSWRFPVLRAWLKCSYVATQWVILCWVHWVMV